MHKRSECGVSLRPQSSDYQYFLVKDKCSISTTLTEVRALVP